MRLLKAAKASHYAKFYSLSTEGVTAAPLKFIFTLIMLFIILVLRIGLKSISVKLYISTITMAVP